MNVGSSGKALTLWMPPSWWRIRLATVNSFGLKNSILESSSKRRLVCLKQETTNVAGWIGTYHFFIRTSSPHPLWKAILCSFCCGHHWRLHRRGLKRCRRLKRDRGAYYLFLGGGGGRRKKWNVRFYFQPPPPPPPPPTFYFAPPPLLPWNKLGTAWNEFVDYEIKIIAFSFQEL